MSEFQTLKHELMKVLRVTSDQNSIVNISFKRPYRKQNPPS